MAKPKLSKTFVAAGPAKIRKAHAPRARSPRPWPDERITDRAGRVGRNGQPRGRLSTSRRRSRRRCPPRRHHARQRSSSRTSTPLTTRDWTRSQMPAFSSAAQAIFASRNGGGIGHGKILDLIVVEIRERLKSSFESGGTTTTSVLPKRSTRSATRPSLARKSAHSSLADRNSSASAPLAICCASTEDAQSWPGP